MAQETDKRGKRKERRKESVCVNKTVSFWLFVLGYMAKGKVKKKTPFFTEGTLKNKKTFPFCCGGKRRERERRKEEREGKRKMALEKTRARKLVWEIKDTR